MKRPPKTPQFCFNPILVAAGLCARFAAFCTRPRPILAINHDLNVVEAEEVAFGTAVNIAPIDESQDDWICLSPYGEYPNEHGLQIVDRQAAEDMVTEFNSFLGRLGNLFRGRPIYRGHPDARPDLWPDDTRYGRINALEARNDGLYAKVAWNDLGRRNKQEGYWVYPSPAWNFKDIGDGKIRPYRVKSAGLTNTPNIFESVPVTNSRTEGNKKQKEEAVNQEEHKKACEALGLDPTKTTPEQLISAINTLKTEKETATNADKNPAIVAANDAAKKAEDDKKAAEDKAKKAVETAINVRLDHELEKGVITAAEKESLAKKFAEDYAGLDKELKDKKAAVNTKSLGLSPSGKDLSDASKRRIAYNARVDELFAAGCKSIDEVITRMRSNPEDAALLAAMEPKEEKKAA